MHHTADDRHLLWSERLVLPFGGGGMEQGTGDGDPKSAGEKKAGKPLLFYDITEITWR
jgi:hypothetical protein